MQAVGTIRALLIRNGAPDFRDRDPGACPLPADPLNISYLTLMADQQRRQLTPYEFCPAGVLEIVDTSFAPKHPTQGGGLQTPSTVSSVQHPNRAAEMLVEDGY
ncbi:hypothetical protein VP1G_08462 [Cytospora mali]|uniref:Uncharacterized protein n=1 Tax=Cytospora mali TaxID=578113 RepID=A0A194VBC7_CYTMA|nr:hypothetical protein VP1G_08462 [Valsa mali var. pyri (nom. inval.)]